MSISRLGNRQVRCELKCYRIGGVDRYETSLAIAKYFDLTGENICIATGKDFPDALAGSVYAANFNAPFILTDTKPSENAKTYLKGRNLMGLPFSEAKVL